jgi:RNA-directed DNA polymerase
MTAAVTVLEPIVEVDMPAELHGYRPNLSAHTAVRLVDRLLNEGHTRIIEADLADYFGSIHMRNSSNRSRAEYLIGTCCI